MKLLNSRRFVKPFQFEYKPRYWDPEKEALEKKLATGQKRASQADDPEAAKERISAAFNRHNSYNREAFRGRQKQAMRSNIRLFLIIAILAMLAYWLMMRYAHRLDSLM